MRSKPFLCGERTWCAVVNKLDDLFQLDGKEQAALMETHEDERDFYEAAHDLGTQIEEKDHHS